jgi:hypothetical protein
MDGRKSKPAKPTDRKEDELVEDPETNRREQRSHSSDPNRSRDTAHHHDRRDDIDSDTLGEDTDDDLDGVEREEH